MSSIEKATIVLKCKDCQQEQTITLKMTNREALEREIEHHQMAFDLSHHCPQHQERTGFARNS